MTLNEGPNEKDAGNGGTERGKDECLDPEPSPPADDGKTPFQRFEEFAKRVISVPKKEIEEREQAWRDKRKKA